MVFVNASISSIVWQDYKVIFAGFQWSSNLKITKLQVTNSHNRSVTKNSVENRAATEWCLHARISLERRTYDPRKFIFSKGLSHVWICTCLHTYTWHSLKTDVVGMYSHTYQAMLLRAIHYFTPMG
jgi:hypothetical protein